MKTIKRVLVGLTIFIAVGLLAVAYLVSTPAQKVASPEDVFGFSDANRPAVDLPDLKRYVARDGSRLAYRFYDSPSEQLLVFVHGSSYHSAAYHRLAVALSRKGVAKVYLPNLRGHHMSGRRRGDVDYIGQLEDDVADPIPIGSIRLITLGLTTAPIFEPWVTTWWSSWARTMKRLMVPR